MIRPDRAIYPVEFYRRSEEKWKRRARASGATRNLFGSSVRVLNEVWPLTKKATISWPDSRGCVQSAKAYSVSTVRSNNLSTGVSRRS
jgi:hypothetical protein